MSPGLGLGPGSATGHGTTCRRGSPGSPAMSSKLSVLTFSNRHIFICSLKMKGFQAFSKIEWPEAKSLPVSEPLLTI